MTTPDKAISFHLSPSVLKTLARIPVKSLSTLWLNGINLAIWDNVVRFMASDGQILISVQEDTDLKGMEFNITWDAVAFSLAFKAAAKASNNSDFLIIIENNNMTIQATKGMWFVPAAAQQQYPNMDAILAKYAQDVCWVPCICTLNSRYARMAQEISGEAEPLIFVSPDRTEGVVTSAMTSSSPYTPVLSSKDLEKQMSAPACWGKGALAFIIMPIHCWNAKAKNPRLCDHIKTKNPEAAL